MRHLFLHRPPHPDAPTRPDPLTPWDEHEALRAATGEAAVHDARVHGEDLLGPELPFAGQAVAEAATRLDRVDARRVELLAAARREVVSTRSEHEACSRRCDALVAALGAVGVDAQLADLPATVVGLRRRVAVALGLRDPQPWEPHVRLLRRLEAERRRCRRASDGVAEAEARQQDIWALAVAVAQAERDLARERVALYVGTLVGELPPEVLSNGVRPTEQAVEVDLPEWAVQA